MAWKTRVKEVKGEKHSRWQKASSQRKDLLGGEGVYFKAEREYDSVSIMRDVTHLTKAALL